MKPSKFEMEQSPTEKHGSHPVNIQSNSSKSLPRKMSGNGNSFKVEINLTRILSLKRKKVSHKEPCCNPNHIKEIKEEGNKIDDIHYKKAVAKRWRQRRDNALHKGQLFYDNDNSVCELKSFYHSTNNIPYLYSIGFTEILQGHSSTNFLLLKKEQQIYLSRDAFKTFFKEKYGITLFRNPYEAYLFLPKNADDLTIVKIVEKKAQTHNDGSFEPKIWSSISIKKDYEIALGGRFRVEYAICINNVLETQYKNLNIRKLNIIQALLQENNVSLFLGEQPDYLKLLNAWTQFS